MADVTQKRPLTSREAHEELVREFDNVLDELAERGLSVGCGKFARDFFVKEPLRAVSLVTACVLIVQYAVVQAGIVTSSLSTASESELFWASSPLWTLFQGVVIIVYVCADFGLSWRLYRKACGYDASILRAHLTAYSNVIADNLPDAEPQDTCRVEMDEVAGPASASKTPFWSPQSVEGIGNALLLSPTLPSMVMVLRDRTWRWVPYCLLVPGDVVVLGNNSPFLQPTVTGSSTQKESPIFESVPLKVSEFNGESPRASSSFPPPLPSDAVQMLEVCRSSLFIVKEAPIREILTAYDDARAEEFDSGNPRHEPTVFRAQLKLWMRVERWICLGCGLFALVLGIIRFVVQTEQVVSWAHLTLLQPATAVVICLPVARPFLFHIINILELAFVIRISRKDVDRATEAELSSGKSAAQKQAANENVQSLETHSMDANPSLSQCFWRLFATGRADGRVSGAVPSPQCTKPQIYLNAMCLTGTCDDAFSLVDRLGSLTALTCTNLGVLSQSPPNGVVNGSIRKYIDQVCVITPKHTQRTSSGNLKSNAQGSVSFAVTVLDLQPDGTLAGDRKKPSRGLSSANILTGSIYKGRIIGADGSGHDAFSRSASQSSTVPPASRSPKHGGIKFQDSNWRKYLSSLKPLGLSALVHSNPSRMIRRGDVRSSPGSHRQYFAAAPSFAPHRLLLVPYVTRSPLHLEELASAIGFSMHDLKNYLRHHSTVCVIDDGRGAKASALAAADSISRRGSTHSTPTAAATDGVNQSTPKSGSSASGTPHARRQIASRSQRLRASNLQGAATIAHLHKPLFCNHIMQDVRYQPNDFLSPYQCFIAGEPVSVMRRCSKFWDGASAENKLSSSLIQRLRERCSQWASEGRNITAFAYVPTPVPSTAEQAEANGPESTNLDQEVFLRNLMMNAEIGDDNWTPQDMEITAMDYTTTSAENPNVRGLYAGGSGKFCEAAGSNEDWPQLLFQQDPESRQNKRTVFLSYKHTDRPAPGPIRMLRASSSMASTIPGHADGAHPAVFLGFTAAIPRLKPGIQASIDQLTQAGIRFIFFSTESFKKSKALAAKMGMDTGWNSSVSLKASASDSSENGSADKPQGEGWVDKARMPQGIAEIKRHLVKVDDVPLLVPLFTDSTPKAMREMIAIHQENGAVVGVLGSSFHTSNSDIFAQGDFSIAVDFVERGDDDEQISEAAVAVESAVLGFTQAINTVRCTMRLPAMGSLDAMVHLIAEGRRLQKNVQQALLFCLAFHATMVVSYCLALVVASPVDIFPTGTALWFGLVVVPVIAVSMQWAEAEEVEMSRRRMPRLRPGEFGWDVRKALEEPTKMFVYFLVRAFPTAIFVVCVFFSVLVVTETEVRESAAITTSAANATTTGASNANTASPLDIVLWGSADNFQWSEESCLQAQNVAGLVMMLFALRLSLNSMHRNQSIFQGCRKGQRDAEEEAEDETFGSTYDDGEASDSSEDDKPESKCAAITCGAPARNTPWIITVVVLFVLQILWNGVRDRSLTAFGGSLVPWGVWLALFLWPILMTGIDEAIKFLDGRSFETFNRQLWQLFETKLGMHSPQ